MNALMVVYAVVMVWVWVGVAFRIRDLMRDPGNRPLRALLHVVSSFGLVLALIVLAPVVDSIHGVEGLTSTIWHVLACWAAAQYGVFLLHSSYPPEQARPRVRRRLIAFGVAATVMVLAWLLAGERDRAHGMRVIDTSPAAAAWQLAFVMSLAWSLLDGTRLAFQYARQAEQRVLRVGLRLLGAGSIFGLAFCLGKTLTALAQITNVGPIVPGAVQITFVAASMGLILAGVVYPGLAMRIRAIPLWLERRRLHRALWPLWSELRVLFPRQVLGRVPSRGLVDVLTVRNLPLRQYRRVVETRDMLRELRPWFSPEVRDQAARWADEHQVDDPTAFVHGAVIAAAMQDRRAGAPPRDDEFVLQPTSTATLMDEARTLAAIAQAWKAGPTLAGQPDPA